MISKTQWIGISVLALIISLASIGYVITDKTYFCSSRGLTMECARFSASKLRCYPNPLNNKGYRDCPEGWIKLGDYIEPIVLDNSKQVIMGRFTKPYVKVIQEDSDIKIENLRMINSSHYCFTPVYNKTNILSKYNKSFIYKYERKKIEYIKEVEKIGKEITKINKTFLNFSKAEIIPLTQKKICTLWIDGVTSFGHNTTQVESGNLSVGTNNNTFNGGGDTVEVIHNLSTDKLLAFWDFNTDPVGATTCTDVYGDNDGTISSGSTGIVQGDFTRVYQDDGLDTNLEGCRVTSHNFDGISSSFTIYAKVKRDDFVDGRHIFDIDEIDLRFRSANRIAMEAIGLIQRITTAGLMVIPKIVCVSPSQSRG